MIDENVKKAIRFLRLRDMTCSNLGVSMWGNGMRMPQSYARPAGKLLHRMKREGLVEQYYSKFDQHFLWKLTPNGLKVKEAR